MASDRAVFDDGVLRITRTGSPHVLAFAGEIDESNYWGLVDTLAQIAAELSEIHLDLAGVGYCDLAGLRAIVRLARPAANDKAPGDHPAGSHPAGSHPAGSHPAGSHPASDHPASDHPAGGGRRVVLHAVPPQLKTVLGILGWDSVAGLALDEPASGMAPRSGGLVDAGLPELGSL
jgi:hypothetical protein